ncbi:MAG TPA: hypothetical protein ENG96_04490 [Gammaproteobacteria bacterium]|nr:hypothetical protein [Gammaproteobacteria bacterium]
MYRWQSLIGKFIFKEDQILFPGRITDIEGQPSPAIGNAISDQRFSGGTICGNVRFKSISELSACQFIVSYQPRTGAFLTAGIGNDNMFVIRSFHGSWTYHAVGGEKSSLKADHNYELVVQVIGSSITLTVDGVDVLVTNLPFVIPDNQVGLWCRGLDDIVITEYKVQTRRPVAFVVMQFSSPYNELYSEVVHPICNEFNIQCKHADETYGPGVIINDIIRQITESRLVIAEISPANANVYYEVGYAHAQNKPTILIAEKGTKLPFDVSPFRVLFYENSIDGKRRIEEGLRKHIEAVQMESGLGRQ